MLIYELLANCYRHVLVAIQHKQIQSLPQLSVIESPGSVVI